MSTPHPVRYIRACDCCGHVMDAFACKISCPNCGYRLDCSDLTLNFDLPDGDTVPHRTLPPPQTQPSGV